MTDTTINATKLTEPQCKFFVVRKKRLCRMTVKPGRDYCGEHEPNPITDDGKDDRRVPCPNDPKHTCYISRLERHLIICNARQEETPEYIEHNINAPVEIEHCPRLPLSELSKDTILEVIDKINKTYDEHLEGQISSLPDYPIHSAVIEDFSIPKRTENSLRHLRQVSKILHIIEKEGLVNDDQCYVDLGAGKGRLSYYMGWAWAGRVLAVERAAARHKRDNAAPRARRLRADLAHLRLRRAARETHLLAVAKHLCGVATDFALRCACAAACVGAVLATCCHHRCEADTYVAHKQLQELGITPADFNVMLGIVSWATCGDGRSRERRNKEKNSTMATTSGSKDQENGDGEETDNSEKEGLGEQSEDVKPTVEDNGVDNRVNLSQECKEVIGRRAKALVDWGRVLWLRDRGFDARLCYYVPTSVSLENFCIIAKKL